MTALLDVEMLKGEIRDLLDSYEHAVSAEKGPPGPREQREIDRAFKALDTLVDLAKRTVEK